MRVTFMQAIFRLLPGGGVLVAVGGGVFVLRDDGDRAGGRAGVFLLLREAAGFGRDVAVLRLEGDALEHAGSAGALVFVFLVRFVSHAETALNHAFRYHRPVALLMLDIDDFKHYNDNYGHPAGDAAIRRTAEICKSTLRQADLTCRYGGEELAVLLIETDPAAAREVAERVRAAIEAAEIADELPRITVSIGLACFTASVNQQPLGLDELIGEADKQLYRAKMEGKNRVVG